MYGWMDMDGRMAGWMNGWMVGWMNGGMDGWIDGRRDGWMDRCEQTDDEWMNEWID